MAEPTKKKPEEILTSILASGNALDPNAQLNSAPYLPTYSGTPEEMARRQAGLEYNPQIRDVEEASREASIANQRARTQQQSYGAEIDPRLENIYGALGTSLTQRRGETQGNYQSAIDAIRGYYDEASTANQGVNTDILNRLTQSAQQLGLGAAVPDSVQKLMENYQFEQNQLGQSKAGRSANLGTLASEIYGLDTRRIGAASQEGAQERASAQQGVLMALSELLAEGEKEQRGFRSDLTGLKGDQSTAIAQLVAQLTDERSKDTINARSRALEELLGRSNIAESNRSFEENRRLSDRGFAEEQRQFNEQIRQAGLDRAHSAAMSRSSGGGGGRGGGGSGGGGSALSNLLGNTEAARRAGLVGLVNQTSGDIRKTVGYGELLGAGGGYVGTKKRGGTKATADRLANRAIENALGVGPGALDTYLQPTRPSPSENRLSEVDKIKKTGSYKFGVNFVQNTLQDYLDEGFSESEARRRAKADVISHKYYKPNRKLYDTVFKELRL